MTIRKTYINIKPLTLAIAVAAMAACIAPSEMRAEIVTQKKAMSMAQQFFNQAYKEPTAPVKMVYNGKRLTTDRLFTPFYVYNQPRGGFVIISAENKTFPILAYSLKSNFDPDALTDSERAWLQSYAWDIELIRYDSRVPDAAVKAWSDYPHFLVSVLDAPYTSTDPRITVEESAASLDEIISTQDTSRDGEYSAFYTPAQWQDMIDEELQSRQSVALGYVDAGQRLFPGVVYGKKGDYYRIAFERRNDWFLRLMPAEYLGERMVASIGNPRYTPSVVEEDTPFEYYDSYSSEHQLNAFPSTASIEESRMALLEDEPVIKNVGGGHFDILLPENAQLAMLYNLNGSHIGRATYGGTSNVAHINLEAEPRGFYFALIFGESGRPYGIKLYR